MWESLANPLVLDTRERRFESCHSDEREIAGSIPVLAFGREKLIWISTLVW